MSDKTVAEVVAEALGKPKPDDWQDQLEGGLDHRPETTAAGETTSDEQLKARAAALRQRVADLGWNRKRNR